MSYDDHLAYGQAGESAISRWLRRKGGTVLPAYEKLIETGKGPQLFGPDRALIAPDLLLIRQRLDDNVQWIEAKHKGGFTWYRNGHPWPALEYGRWTTGIDRRHYQDYLAVAKTTPWPVWLLFLHDGTPTKDSPDGTGGPPGLFGNELLYLSGHVSHESSNYGLSGMVYWGIDDLKLLASLEDIRDSAKPTLQP